MRALAPPALFDHLGLLFSKTNARPACAERRFTRAEDPSHVQDSVGIPSAPPPPTRCTCRGQKEGKIESGIDTADKCTPFDTAYPFWKQGEILSRDALNPPVHSQDKGDLSCWLVINMGYHSIPVPALEGGEVLVSNPPCNPFRRALISSLHTSSLSTLGYNTSHLKDFPGDRSRGQRHAIISLYHKTC